VFRVAATHIRTFTSLSLVLATLLLAGAELRADTKTETVVVPSARKTTEGNAENFFPLDLGDLGLHSQRYQQVYKASEFTSFGGPIRVTEIAFRPDPFWGDAFQTTLPGVEIHLSTTSKVPDGLSTTFASNLGADDTLVFNGSLQLSSSFTGPVDGPKAFDVRIVLTTPFVYDPTAGNLLLDIRNLQGGTTTILDAEMQFGDTTSRVYSYAVPDSVLNPTGFLGGTSSVGLVTEFTVIPVVEEIEVAVDIRPGGCPNPLNVAAGGVLPVAVLGTADFDVTHVDPASVRLAGVEPLRWALEDVATPFQPFTGKSKASDCNTLGADGRVDLSLKFDVPAIIAAIKKELGRELNDGEVLVLSLTGNLLEAHGGGAIVGEDTVVIQQKKK
jgi:hypothetical protein